MAHQFVPTEYHLEAYEDSFANPVSYHLQSSTPFGGVSVGDTFNHRVWDGWGRLPNTSSEKFFIKEIEHIFWTIEGSHNAHKIMVLLEIRPYRW